MHVQSKVSSWFSLPLGFQYKEFKSEFDVLCHLENNEEFEHWWNRLVDCFGLGSDKHVSLLFSYRASWPFSYVRDYFVAHTMTPDYSYSVDLFLKCILCGQTGLQLLFEQVGNAAHCRYQTQGEAQYMHLKTYLPTEEHACSVLPPAPSMRYNLRSPNLWNVLSRK